MPIDPQSNLYFESSGPDSAQTIVFLHGGGAAGWMWRAQVRALAPAYHCLVPDLPEQGQTTLAGVYTPESAADRVAGLIRSQAHRGRAVVVGLSEGAQVLVSLLARTPQVVERALISSAILRPLPGAGMYTPGMIAWSYRWFVAPLKNNDGWIRLNMKYAAGIPAEYYPEFKRSFQEQTESGMVNMLVSNLRFRLPDGLQKADLPVLVVVGSREYKQMKASGRDLVQALPQARGVTLSLGPKSSLAAEHNWAMTAPALFTAALQAFLADRPLPPELRPF